MWQTTRVKKCDKGIPVFPKPLNCLLSILNPRFTPLYKTPSSSVRRGRDAGVEHQGLFHAPIPGAVFFIDTFSS
jgi:hypothetical protein